MGSSHSDATPDRLAGRGLAATALAAVVPTLDSTISAVAVPAQGRVFGTGFASEQWMLNLAPLVITLLLVPAGLAADRSGRRRLLRIGLTVVCFGAALSGCASGVPILLAGRALTGAGGACVLPATIALVRQHSPRTPARTRRFGLLAGWAGLAAALGPLAGGLLVDHLLWRWVYAVPATLAVVALAGTRAIADDDARTRARSALSDAPRDEGRGGGRRAEIPAPVHGKGPAVTIGVLSAIRRTEQPHRPCSCT
jgi:MFS family permease